MSKWNGFSRSGSTGGGSGSKLKNNTPASTRKINKREERRRERAGLPF